MQQDPERVAAYVDGFNPYHGMHDARGRRPLWLDLPALLKSFVGHNQRLVAAHYFTALVRGDGRARQRIYIEAATIHGGGLLMPHVGRFQRKSVTCHRCGRDFHTYEEKESDVSLAVRLAEDATTGVFDQALIVSGDSDMAPAVRSVRRLRPDARLLALFPPRRSNSQLERLVDSTVRIYDKIPERFQLPDPVIGPDGSVHHRPPHWK